MLVLRSHQHPEATLHPHPASAPSTATNQLLPPRSRSPTTKTEPTPPPRNPSYTQSRVTKPFPQKSGKVSLKLRLPPPPSRTGAKARKLAQPIAVPKLKLSWKNRNADLARELVQTLNRLDSLSLQVLEKGSRMGEGVLQVYWQLHMETRGNIVGFLEGLGRREKKDKGTKKEKRDEGV
ncbi:hypothetical protein E8E13_002456 [Curvularia kusanoi]|uniref:Uncharacterized protein n=1 Tax=Curvularia kusanoi TaxID=90978 RepID=A0A9P4W601_CURKU|nr:hypothetical protein E8E13_002456 [Curvularia kusanoi]